MQSSGGASLHRIGDRDVWDKRPGYYFKDASTIPEHFERLLAQKKFAEAITRADIDYYKAKRSREKSQQHKNRPITPRTINLEVCMLRTFFYFLANERGLRIENPESTILRD